MLAFDEAQKRVLALAEVLGAERVRVPAVAGRVLAEDVRAKVDSPSFDASMMDGYAVRAAGVQELRGAMRVTGESRAGVMPKAVAAGDACRIFTGAPMPGETDAVVMQEDADREGDVVRFRVKPKAGAFVRRRGDDLRAGDVALARGTRLGAREIALLSSLDAVDVAVARPPRVIILPTGDELRAPGTEGNAASIPESNAPALAAMARHTGATVALRDPVTDDADLVRRAFEDVLGQCDLLVTIGGVSAGDHDVVRAALEASGVTLDFWRVAIKPGKPLAVGRKGKCVVVGLPGNPVSAMVTFAMFAMPLLRAMQGDGRPLPRTWPAALGEPIARQPSERLELARARVDDRGRVVVLGQQASGAIIGLCLADVLACIPPQTQRLDAGSAIDVYPFAELGL